MRVHPGRAVVGVTLAAALAVAPVTGAAAGAAPAGGDRRLLQQAAGDLTELGVTGVQAIAADGRRTSTARSGVADIRTGAPVPHLPGLASAEAYLEHRFTHLDPAELVAVAMKHEPVFAPGTSWDYSNTNYILAGMIVEEITGKAWATSVRERITRPLGLSRTYSPGDVPSLPRPHARAYQQFEPGGPLLDTTLLNVSWGWAAGDLVTTPSDLVRFWQALQSGRLLRPAQMAEMHRTVLAETWQDAFPGTRYGLGIMWSPSSCGGYWGHGGDVPGVSTVDGVTGDGRQAVVLAITTRLAGDEEALAVYHRADRAVGDILC